MSDDIEAVKAIATHPATGAGIVGLFGWLANKVYRSIGHRINNVEQAQTSGFAAVNREMERRRDADEKLFNMIREHEHTVRDRFERMDTSSNDRHDEIMAAIGDLRVDVAGLQK